jgi:hypothetical protein
LTPMSTSPAFSSLIVKVLQCKIRVMVPAAFRVHHQGTWTEAG